MQKYIDLIEKAYNNAENNISKINDEIISMEGMTGTKTRHFYNNLLDYSDARYLEIGTWKGSSASSAMIGNKAKVFCIDNWDQFNGPPWGDIKSIFLSNFEKFKGDNDATFIEKNCWEVDVSTLPKFNIYLFDGDHTEEAHYKSLFHYYDCLDDVFIFLVDDWNWSRVRNGTKRAIDVLNLKVLYEKEIRLTWDESHTPQPQAGETWWNGIYISVLQKPQ
jgi:hypothetical protein